MWDSRPPSLLHYLAICHAAFLPQGLLRAGGEGSRFRAASGRLEPPLAASCFSKSPPCSSPGRLLPMPPLPRGGGSLCKASLPMAGGWEGKDSRPSTQGRLLQACRGRAALPTAAIAFCSLSRSQTAGRPGRALDTVRNRWHLSSTYWVHKPLGRAHTLGKYWK